MNQAFIVKKNSFIGATLLGLWFVLAMEAHAGQEPDRGDMMTDDVVLNNGSRIIGNIISARDGTIVIETEFAGTLNIDSSMVESMESQRSMEVLMNDGSVIRDQPIRVDAAGLHVTSGSGSQSTIARKDYRLLNPEPWELGDGYKFSGLVNVAWEIEKGNTKSDELDVRLESVWRSIENRFKLDVIGEIDEANGEKSADNWMVVGKYDHFLKDRDYWGVKFAANQDEFADLDLRAYVGPYYGRQFFEDPILTLSGELGLSLVSENFIVAENQEYPGAHWDIDFSSNYFGGNSRLYVNHVGLWNLKDTGDIILNTRLGLAFPLVGNLEAAAELFLEYDSGAVQGVEKLDQTYKFRIGYTW